MNYIEFIELLEQISLQHPLINNFYTGTYRLNSTDDITYPALVLTFNSINVSVTDPTFTTFNINLLYADRLTDDRSNLHEIQSLGITVISEIIQALILYYNIQVTTNILFNPFKEQFADNTAGVVATINISIPSATGNCYWFDPSTKCKKC